MVDALTKAAKELEEANEHFKSAEQRHRDASREHTAAINRLNDKQKKFDAVIDEMKKSAPRESGWHHGIGER